MKTWHIRVVDVHGQALTQKRALLRFAFCWVWFFPPLVVTQLVNANIASTLLACFLWIIIWAMLSRLHPDGQFWHDHWSGSRLVDVRPPSAVHANDLNV
jgi:uncharacterized RDD family membrane protein YckC